MFSDMEIKEAVFQMEGLNAPGLDGFQGLFYSANWICQDVRGMAKELRNGDVCLECINSTHIALVPKVQNPETVTQFYPISSCNYSYKVLLKVLANRLKPLPSNLIYHMQNAFVTRRQIQDSIVIAHEMFHILKLRKAKTRFELGIKLDMNKAYDRIE